MAKEPTVKNRKHHFGANPRRKHRKSRITVNFKGFFSSKFPQTGAIIGIKNSRWSALLWHNQVANQLDKRVSKTKQKCMILLQMCGVQQKKNKKTKRLRSKLYVVVRDRAIPPLSDGPFEGTCPQTFMFIIGTVVC